MAIDYTFQPGETADAYKARTQAAIVANNPNDPNAARLAPTPATQAPTYSGNSVPTYGPPPTPVGALSSSAGLDTLNKNTQSLQNLENSYQYVDTAGNMQTTKGATPEEAMKNAPNIDPHSGVALMNPTNSPAASAMTTSINNSVSQGGMSGTEVAGLKNLQSSQDQIVQAAARARSALDSKDYTSMDTYVKDAQARQQAYTDQLAQYHADTQSLRQKSLDLLSPSAREQELGRQLTDIRGQADAFNLQTEQDKMSEFQGQTMGFAGGRAAELDFKASFKRQEMQNKEKNLLSSLGLEQDMRKMQQTGVDQQLGFLASDYELQTKVQDKLAVMEDDIFQKANTLQQQQKSTLVTMLDQLKGVDPSTMPKESMANLESLATRAGLPFDLVLQALQTQHARQVFEDSLQTQQDGGAGFTLGEGQTRFDAQGNVIASGPAKSGGGANGLTPGQIQSSVTGIVSQFDNEPIVKSFNVIAEGYQFAQSLAGKSNPTSSDDQGLIYAFAKAMDPSSAVKEGEYTTVQKYSQSMIQSGWANAQRIASNQPFLTAEARTNMAATIQSKYQASLANYQNVKTNYERKIQDAKSGAVSGSLTDYAAGYSTSTSQTPTNQTSTPPLAQQQSTDSFWGGITNWLFGTD